MNMKNMKTLNEITIRRMNKVVLTSGGNSDVDSNAIVAGLSNLSSLGYCLNMSAFRAVSSVDDIQTVIEAARSLKGANVSYEPMYPNFPKQVAKATDAELYTNAMMVNIGDVLGVAVMPKFSKKTRKPLKDKVQVVALGVASDDDLRALVSDIMVQGQPFSERDKGDLVFLSDYAPKTAPVVKVKENLAWLTVMFDGLDFTDSYKGATDVLRLAVAMSDGDVSLSQNTKFKTFSRPERRVILSLLNKVGNAEDMGRWDEQWKRLAKHLRVSDYADRYPNAALLLHKVARNHLPRSFDSKVEEAIALNDVEETVALLKTRPGVFARRLNEVLGMVNSQKKQMEIVKSFGAVADKVSLPVLVQVWGYFASPDNSVIPNSVVTIKAGSNQKTKVIENKHVQRAVDTAVLEAIESGIRAQGNLGKVFLNRDLFEQFAVPLGVRSASSGLRIAGRGSRLKFGDKGTIRLFMHWHDIVDADYFGGRVDLDLSAFFLSDDFTRTSQIAYYNLRDNMAAHSGDITGAPKGAAEFIDIDIDKALKAGWRYVVMTVHTFTGQNLDVVPETYAGFTMREKVKSGEVFEPSTVEQKIDLTSQSCNATPFIFDLLKREAIWWDNATSVSAGSLINLRSNASATLAHAQHLVLGKKMMLDRLVGLLADEIVDDKEEAEIVFDADGDVSPWAIEKILGFLA